LPDGQAGAAAAAELGDKSNSAALCFRSHQDALNFASHSVENSNRMLAFNNLVDVIERYRVGDICIVASDFRTGANSKKYNLVFVAIPFGRSDCHRACDCDRAGHEALERHANRSPCNSNGDEDFVLGRVRKFIQSPQGVIPSFVWAEPFKERPDYRRQILASTLGIVEHFRLSWSKGELSGRGIDLSGVDNSDRKGHLIKDGPEIVSGVENDAREIVGQSFVEFDLMEVSNSIDVFLNDMGPWLVVHESGDLRAKIIDVMLCTTEHVFGTCEQVNHGKQTRSDERPRLSKGGPALRDDAAKASFGNEARQA
jgi:hypothetical protein